MELVRIMEHGRVSKKGWTRLQVRALLREMLDEARNPEDMDFIDQVPHFTYCLEYEGVYKTQEEVQYQLVRLYKKYFKLRLRTLRGRKMKQNKPWMYLNEMDKIIIKRCTHKAHLAKKFKSTKKLVKCIGVRRYFIRAARESRHAKHVRHAKRERFLMEKAEKKRKAAERKRYREMEPIRNRFLSLLFTENPTEEHFKMLLE